MTKSLRILAALSAALIALPVRAQTPPGAERPAPHKSQPGKGWRTGLSLAGSGGGFAAGVMAGLTLFDDDAINSDQTLWTFAGVMAAAGGVIGYLAGRRIDLDRSARSDRASLDAEEPRAIELSDETLAAIAAAAWAPYRSLGMPDDAPSWQSGRAQTARSDSIPPDLRHGRAECKPVQPSRT